MYENARELNQRNILQMLGVNESAKILDLGCNDGKWTLELAKKVNTRNIYGIDIVEKRLNLAKKKGIKTINGDLNCKFPVKDNSFDIVHANQVIEHISNLDSFLSEIRRILKPGGYAIISTENGSSWHNIFAALMGWQIFSLTNFSSVASGVGNPLAIHHDGAAELSSWTHKTIFNYNGLKEYFAIFKFKNTSSTGAGYYPLPAEFGKLDVRHAHFITFRCYK